MSFDTLGHPGKWKKSVQLSGANNWFATGSNFGAGAILLSGSVCNITLSAGGSVSSSALVDGVIYEFSPIQVQVDSGDVFVLYPTWFG